MKEIKLRFINFLLDTIFYFIVLLVFLSFFNNSIEKKDVKWVSIILYFLYYFFLELIFGQTIGKLITKTKVISLNENKNYYFLQIFVRTLMRYIILDWISYLFSQRILHDWISKTTITKL